MNFHCLNLPPGSKEQAAAAYTLCTNTRQHDLTCMNGAMVARVFLPLALVGLLLASPAASDDGDQFLYAGFTGANLTLDGAATVTAAGLLELTNGTTHQKGHAFHPTPLHLRGGGGGSSSSPNGTAAAVQSFSAAFVFAIVSNYSDFSTHGLALAVAPSTASLSAALTDQYLGLTNAQDDGNATNRLLAVELDTVQNIEFRDISANHVGVDVNGLTSALARDAAYYADDGGLRNLSLISGDPMQVWVDYDAAAMLLNVTLAPVTAAAKPRKPLLSYPCNLSAVLAEPSFVGFSSATGPGNSRHYVLGWSFGANGRPAPAIDVTKLPRLPPRLGPPPSDARSKVLEIALPLASAALVLAAGAGVALLVRRRRRYAELREDWEVEFGPHRFAYRDLFRATKGFKERNLLGAGGFGMVYRGVLPESGVEVAVKKVSHGSKQGVKEFVAEIASIGRIRHRNLVQLLGYCRRKDELILVYEYMPNGSLDRYLHSHGGGGNGGGGGGGGDDPAAESPTLDWAQRLHVIRGVAAGLHYLHERWEKVVVHRDVKSSNVLLDGEGNGRLGDFGLAKLSEHGAAPQTTRVVGTTGYLAPELVRTGRAAPPTDVFAFGTLALEVACGRRPIVVDDDDDGGGERGHGHQTLLVDWVLRHWHAGTLAEAVDPRLTRQGEGFDPCLVLKVGLLCSHPSAAARPSMLQVLRYLDGEAPLPEMASADLSFDTMALMQMKGFNVMSCPPCSTSSAMVSAGTISDLSGGR